MCLRPKLEVPQDLAVKAANIDERLLGLSVLQVGRTPRLRDSRSRLQNRSGRGHQQVALLVLDMILSLAWVCCSKPSRHRMIRSGRSDISLQAEATDGLQDSCDNARVPHGNMLVARALENVERGKSRSQNFRVVRHVPHAAKMKSVLAGLA